MFKQSRCVHIYIWLLFIFAAASTLLSAQTTSELPFTPTAISSNAKALFVCGSEQSIAASEDGGKSWKIQNRKPDSGALLSISWSGEALGFAGGTGGIVLLSADAGKSWQQVSTSFTEPVLQVSFSDPQHGIVLTSAEVRYTNDGGKDWKVAAPSNDPESGKFKYVLAVAALDETHAAMLLKEGNAQYYGGRVVTTSDAGVTWKFQEIEHTVLNNLLVARGEYWLVGIEVIDRENHGGHGVAVSFHSKSGTNWDRGPQSPKDTNNACRPEGCLMWDGAIFDPFDGKGSLHAFPTIPKLSVQWAATPNRLCSLTPKLECVDLTVVTTLPERTEKSPQLAAYELRPTTADMGGKCIRCDFPHILVSKTFSGKVKVELLVYGRPDGTVYLAEVKDTPDKEVGEELAKAAQGWIFYPYMKDGVAISTRRPVKLDVQVIKND